jgi:hypothetical protein
MRSQSSIDESTAVSAQAIDQRSVLKANNELSVIRLRSRTGGNAVRLADRGVGEVGDHPGEGDLTEGPLSRHRNE